MWDAINVGEACVESAIKQFLPPCQKQCPVNEDIQRTNVLISLLPEDPAQAKDGLIQIGDYLSRITRFFRFAATYAASVSWAVIIRAREAPSDAGF